MAIATSASCVLATSLFVVLFAAMQVYRVPLSSTQLMTIFGGYLGSVLFMLGLTAIGNLETTIFGKGAHTNFPEVLVSLVISMFASGLVHRVCITTCFIFSLVTLYYMNKISAKAYGHSAPVVSSNAVQEKRKRK